MRRCTLVELKPGMVLAQDIYAQSYVAAPFLLQGVSLSAAIIQRLPSLGITEVFVRQGPSARFVPSAQALPLAPRSHAVRTALALDEPLRQSALAALGKSHSEIVISDHGITGTQESMDELITVVSQVVTRVVHLLSRHEGAMLSVNNLKSVSDFTLHHALGVAVLAVAIGREMGFATPKLNRLGLGAILHDIGKTAVPLTLTHKAARLSQNEYDLVKTHANAGTRYLIGTSLGDEGLWRAVLFHHEKLDGSGYPKGLKGGAIPLWSRIIAVADVYDALTSARPYRPAIPPADALEYLMGGAGAAFDYDVVHALMDRLDPYPVGSLVELSNGRMAMVLDNENKARPLVRLAGSHEEADLFRDRRWLNVVVRRVVPG